MDSLTYNTKMHLIYNKQEKKRHMEPATARRGYKKKKKRKTTVIAIGENQCQYIV